MYRLPEDADLTEQMIIKYIEKDISQKARKEKLFNYYLGKHDILKRAMKDISKPNNKIINPFPHYITDTITGYFVGEPITYKCADEDLLARFTQVFNYNDEARENTELAKDASICGVAFELLYIDADGEIRFKHIEPTQAIPIYDNTIDEELLYFIRYYSDTDIITNNTITYIEVYGRNSIRKYKRDAGALTFIEEIPHTFGAVPIIIYKNNEEETGDFESVVSLIDAYDKLSSDTLNDYEYFVDAYLCLYGMMGTDAEDVASMKENRVLLMDTDARAEWLTKTTNDGYIENLKTRIAEDIHKFSFCPSLTDADFASNASGVAMKYKLLGLENSTAKKEASFKKGIQRRIELICNIFSIMGSSFDYRSIEIVFTRNLPANIEEIANLLNQIGHLLSKQTQLSLLPFDIDFTAEQARIEAEDEQGYDGYEELLGKQNTSE